MQQEDFAAEWSGLVQSIDFGHSVVSLTLQHAVRLCSDDDYGNFVAYVVQMLGHDEAALVLPECSLLKDLPQPVLVVLMFSAVSWSADKQTHIRQTFEVDPPTKRPATVPPPRRYRLIIPSQRQGK